MMTLLWRPMSLELYIYTSAISISLLFSCFLFLKASQPIYLKTFTPFLLISLIIEIIAIRISESGKTNTTFYNFSTTFEAVFYLWVLFNIVSGKLIKKIILISLFIYPILCLLDIYVFQSPSSFHTVSYAFGCLLLIFFSIVYFYELFANPKAITLSKEPAFWICSGLLFFYSVTFPLFVCVNIMKTFPAILSNNLQYILIVLNVFLYLQFSIAFLCRITIKKS